MLQAGMRHTKKQLLVTRKHKTLMLRTWILTRRFSSAEILVFLFRGWYAHDSFSIDVCTKLLPVAENTRLSCCAHVLAATRFSSAEISVSSFQGWYASRQLLNRRVCEDSAKYPKTKRYASCTHALCSEKVSQRGDLSFSVSRLVCFPTASQWTCVRRFGERPENKNIRMLHTCTVL